MKRFLNGYWALVREAARLPNDGSFLSVPAGLPALVLVCGTIGLARNALSAGLGILPFYSYRPDILWTMFMWPAHLFLFPSALLHAQLRLMGNRAVSAESVFALAFYLQIVHLIVPLFDWLGLRLGIPWGFVLGENIVTTDWYVNRLVMTLGIIVAWIVTGYMVAKAMKQRLGVNWLAVVLSSIVTFVVILIPTYFVWPTFNTLFNRTFGLLVLDPMDPRLQVPRQIYWGYGTYFASTALIGAFYFLRQRRLERKA